MQNWAFLRQVVPFVLYVALSLHVYDVHTMYEQTLHEFSPSEMQRETRKMFVKKGEKNEDFCNPPSQNIGPGFDSVNLTHSEIWTVKSVKFYL